MSRTIWNWLRHNNTLALGIGMAVGLFALGINVYLGVGLLISGIAVGYVLLLEESRAQRR